MHTISQIHDLFDAGKLTVSELTEQYLIRITDSKLNAYLSVAKDRARKQASVLDAELKNLKKVPRDQKPLFGIPLGIKDVLTIEGLPTTCASKMLEGYVPPYTATAVQRLEAAGAISLGKLNMDEFAMGGSNENSAFGPVEHPTHPGYVPGGSSGGSAAAVGADLCVASLGTDTGGSIRLPAHYCGIYGFKPTYGRISRYGLVAFASSLDQIGPMAKSTEDCARLYSVMAGPDLKDSTCSQEQETFKISDLSTPVDFKNLKVGVPVEFYSETTTIQPSVRRAMEQTLTWLKSKGAKVVDVQLPHSKYSVAVYYVVAVSEASSNLSRFDGVHYGVRTKEATQAENADAFYEKARSLFGPEVKRRIILGTFALSSGYYDAYFTKACQVRRLIQNDFTEAFKYCDVILGPVSTSGAFKRGELQNDPLAMYLNDLYTIPANLAGLPAMSFPVTYDEAGLPIGLQWMAPRFEDAKVLRLSAQFEKDHFGGAK